MNYFERAKEILPEMVEARRYIHRNAEVGFELPLATAFVMEKLIELDYEPQEICKSGVVATIGKPGKCVLLRADMDALTCLWFCTARLMGSREGVIRGT